LTVRRDIGSTWPRSTCARTARGASSVVAELLKVAGVEDDYAAPTNSARVAPFAASCRMRACPPAEQ
jgi:hypothetical protein